MDTSFDRVADGKDEWLTPKYITDFIGADLDPCSPGQRRPWDTAKNHIGLPQDGLSAQWQGMVFCNPPYGAETEKWMRRCAEYGNAIALTFARTETKWFQEWVWKQAHGVLFFQGRLRFHHVDGTPAANGAGAPSVMVAYGFDAVQILQAFEQQHGGKFVFC